MNDNNTVTDSIGDEPQRPLYTGHRPTLVEKIKAAFRGMRYATRNWIAQRAINLVVRMNRDSNMVAHCRRECSDWLEEEPGPSRWVAEGTIELLAVLAHQGHSGGSIGFALNFFERMAKFEPWGPLLGTDDEWQYVEYDDDMAAQNIRCSHVFKRADGTCYDIYGIIWREPDGMTFTNADSHVDVTFPYTPTHEIREAPPRSNS